MKKINLILVVVSFLVILNFGAKKKKNINKYIFASGYDLVVFDGETKTVQRKEFSKNPIKGILYFPKVKRIALFLDGINYKIISINVNDLSDFKEADISKLRKTDKPKYFISSAIVKYKFSQDDSLMFRFTEWDVTDDEAASNPSLIRAPKKNTKYRRGYIWNVESHIFQEVPLVPWNNLKSTDDIYPVYDSFFISKFGEVTEEIVKQTDNARKNNFQGIPNFSRKDRMALQRKISKRGLMFKNLLKKEKIAIGDYTASSIDDMSFMVTGGRYIAVLNDKIYLVHMKTKKVYTLIPEKQNINYFIIEKNEDDLDLDKE